MLVELLKWDIFSNDLDGELDQASLYDVLHPSLGVYLEDLAEKLELGILVVVLVVFLYEVVEVRLQFELALAEAEVVAWQLWLILIHLNGEKLGFRLVFI